MAHFDAEFKRTQDFVGTLAGLTFDALPDGVAEVGWTVPQNPSDGSADVHQVSGLAQLREVAKHAVAALKSLRSIRAPLVRACIAKNKRRRVQAAVTTREDIRDQNAALQAQLRQNQRDLKFRHLREDRAV